MIARVIPLTQTRAIRGLFDYAVPAERAGIHVGSLLRVPFAGRDLIAVVAEIATTSDVDPEKLATAGDLLPARLPADLVTLAIWLAREYCSTPARALQLLLPAGATRGLTEKRVLVASITDAGRLALHSGPPAPAPAKAPARTPAQHADAGLPVASNQPDRPLTDGQRSALEALAAKGPLPATQLGTPLLRRLEARGFVQLRHVTSQRRPANYAVSSTTASAPPLTVEQEAALSSVISALARQGRGPEITDSAGSPGELLLNGVTGSGKTEIYLRAAQETLKNGRDVIILVPEIGLTPQALARFRARLGDVVAVMHSGMSAGQRNDEWLRLARGEARVCVGPRSAIFAPLADIGLIVVDEEHESSYKHDSDPRYDARTVAGHRAHEHGAVLLLGSATPRPESVFGTRALRLTRRVDGRPLPSVEILDMRAAHNPLHPQARMALADCRQEGGKAIVLLNRRGWSNFLSCGSCGRVWGCPNCEVSLVLHRSEGFLACHHCGHRERPPSSCPDCGSVSVARHGAGTERLEHELLTTLATPGFPVLRLDADTAGVDARARVLERFQAASSGVLVGTQMIAKGHDFADVGLGVVVDADQTLRFPDFRAEERTFALLTQLAGRTGRGQAGGGAGVATGRVLVQTSAPQARAIVLASRHDSDTFVRGELRRRKALAYPPFVSLIRVVCSATDPEAALAATTELKTRTEPRGATVLGPAPLFALRGRARSQLVIKASDRRAAIAAVGEAVGTVSGERRHREVAFAVDVDPQ